MQGWTSTYLGLREVTRELSQFELQAFFTFSPAERAVIQRRRGPTLKLGLALHLGFVRMSGRPLDAFRVLPVVLLRHLGRELGIPVPDVASLRALYRRRKTLSEHQRLAWRVLGFDWMTEHQRRGLVRSLKDEVLRYADRDRLLAHARSWLYEQQALIVHDRVLLRLVTAAVTELEADTTTALCEAVPPALWQRWLEATTGSRADGQAMQSWLWAAPAKHSTRQISEMFERVEFLLELGVDRALTDVDVSVVRRYARRLAARSPSVSARVREPTRSVEVACFLRQSLLSATDHWILMVQRRVVELWRQCGDGVIAPVDWAARYRALLDGVVHLSASGVPAEELRTRLAELVGAERRQRRPSRAAVIRQRLMDAIRPVRSLLAPLARLQWQAKPAHPVLQALDRLRSLYAVGHHILPADTAVEGLGRVWSAEIGGTDRERAFRALEVATLFAWRRSVRSGSVWLEHSLVLSRA